MQNPVSPGQMPFRETIAHLYRLLGFEVHHQYQLDSLSIDLFVQKRHAGISTEIVIECLEQAPSAQELSAILDQHRRIAASHPSFSRILVTAQNLSGEIRDALLKAGTHPISYAELIGELAPLDEYARGLIADCAHWRDEQWRGEDWYVPPEVRLEGEINSRPAAAFFAQWLEQPQSRMLVLLGGPGTGKSTLIRALAREAAEKFLDGSLRHPAPLLIPLGEVRLAESWESLLSGHFNQRGLPAPPLSHLDYLARQGRIILFLDAFDEMSDRAQPDVIRSNFRELMRPVQQGWKTVFTCRPQYFKNREEFFRLFREFFETAGESQTAATGLPGIETIHLQSFSDRQIDAYRAKARPDLSAEVWRRIMAIYGLKEMAGHPLLLEMILQSSSGMEDINPAEFYAALTNQWIEREARRSQLLTRKTKRSLIKSLAWRMWADGKESFSDNEIARFIEGLKQERRQPLGDEAAGEIARHLEAASFLTRDGASNFSFTHESLGRYFLARKLCDFIANIENRAALKTALEARPIDRETLRFLAFLLDEDEKTLSLQLILNDGYQPRISENALLILYWRARIRCGMEERIGDLKALLKETAGAIPPGAKLAGADLRGAQFPAVDLTGADFQGADLRDADFSHAHFPRANFRNAAIHGAIFHHACLTRCDFAGATGATSENFTGADSTGASGLPFS